MANEIQLPETIIRQIQSLLTPRQAARTSILSKSWHAAWLTRPNLEFDESDFEDGYRRGDLDELSEFAKTTFQRYVKSNQKIESLRLSLCCSEGRHSSHDDPFGLSDEIIVKALRLGATRLDLRLTKVRDSGQHSLPHDVFEAENLVGLAVAGYKIYDQLLDKTVRCSKLESLGLKDVQIKRDRISYITSTCPLIKKLSLFNVWEWDRTKWCSKYVRVGLTNLPMLTSLVLRDVKVDDAFFLGDLSSKFPNLKDLTLELFNLCDEMRISSCSLERLSLHFDHYWHPNTVLDVPRIRKFEFNGSVIPKLGFQSASKEWESHITISYSDFNALMFGKVSKLLTELSQSKIYLSLKVCMQSYSLCDYEIEGLEGLPCRHQVEHLTVEMACHLPSLTSYAFYDGLFRICRPKLVTQYQVSKFDNSNNDFLSKILQQGTQGKFSSPDNFLYGLHDLEEVHVKPFDEVDAVWRLLTRDSWSDITALAYHDDVQKVWFYLKWRALP